MGAVANAAILIEDPEFQGWCMAAAAYQARQVILEDPATPGHAERLSLATSVVNAPETYQRRFTVYVATDPQVATKGSTAAAVGEQTVLDKVEAIWTTVATIGSVAA
jgi:hypothetical protein